MLKVQVALIAILIASVAFVSCEKTQQMLDPVADDMMATDDMMAADSMMMDMMKMLDSSMYMSWAHVALPAPAPMAEATSPIETGAAHNPAHVETGVTTSRTVYINDTGAVANKAGATEYPDGTIIVKAIMDDTETFVDKVAVMMKSDDEMYTGHNGWVYKKYARSSADGEYMQVRGSNLEDAGNGCHGCHVQADNDSVFVSLPMDDPDDIMADDMTDDGTDDMDDMGDDGMDGDGANGADANGNMNGAGNGTDANGGDANGGTNGADPGAGDANGDAQ